MVQSLFAETKAEGGVGGAKPGSSDGEKSELATVTTAADSVSNGSDGEICLFSSTEELLNSDQPNLFYQFQQQLQQQAPVNGISGSGRSSVNGVAVRRQLRNNSSIENGFSIESRDTFSNTCDSFNSQDLYGNNSNGYFRNNNNSQQQYRQFNQQAASSCCWPIGSRHWNLASWRAQLTKLTKMSLRRYYSLMLCLCLIIISCLLASFVISRNVGGDLEEHSSSTGRGTSQSRSGDDMASTGQPMKLSSAPIKEGQLEQRYIDLVDLIECGKTFAYTKYRIQVRVAKSSPIYQQRPAFLHSSSLSSQQDSQLVVPPSAAALAAAAVGEHRGEPGHGPAARDHHKFVLTSLEEPNAADDEEQWAAAGADSQANGQNPSGDGGSSTSRRRGFQLLEADASEHRGNTGLWPPDSLQRGPPIAINPLILDIKHAEPKAVAANNNNDPAQLLAALLAFMSSSLADDGDQSAASSEQIETNQADASNPDMLLEPDDELDRLGPLEDAVASMGLMNLKSANKSLIDCFMVDTDRRYGQKVALEDAYRRLASTRKVSFKKMMNTITECRLLTWASLPNLIRVPVQPQVVQLQPLDGAASNVGDDSNHEDFVRLDRAVEREKEKQQEQQRLLPQSFVGSLLATWLNGAASQEQRAPEAAVAQAIAMGENAALESGESPQSLSLPPSNPMPSLGQPAPGPDNLDRRRQNSYLNMGISMMSGIIPNTLWCGQGDRAANYSELGAEYKVDSCCRAHDHCPIRIKPFTTDYGLANWSMSTRSHCACDVDFGQCLTAVNSTLSNVIKVLYFRFVGLQCIDVENRHGLLGGAGGTRSVGASSKP